MMSSKKQVHDNISPTNANKIIQGLKKVQFVAEFFVLSKVSENSDYVPEFLMIIEAFKFYFKSLAAVESQSLYLGATNQQKAPEPQIIALRESTSTVDEEVERQKKLMDLIKEKPYETYDYYPGMTEKFGDGKKIQLLTAVELPQDLKKSPLSLKNIIGEVLHLLRPLVSIVCIRVFGINSYKSYIISLLIDLTIIMFFQKKMKVSSQSEKEEISERRREMLMRYIFRKPIFNTLLKYIFIPLLGKILKPERMISKFVLSILEMQSSISLTL